MARYTTVSLMFATYPPIASLSNVQSSDYANYITQAEAVIDGRLSEKYTAPVTDTSPMLQAIATDFAVYNTIIGRVQIRDISTHPYTTKYEMAKDLLDGLVSGTITLTDSAGTVIAPKTAAGEVWSNQMNYVPTFADGISIQESEIDQDKIDTDRTNRGL